MDWLRGDHWIGRAADGLLVRVEKWWGGLRQGLRNPPRHRAMGHLL